MWNGQKEEAEADWISFAWPTRYDSIEWMSLSVSRRCVLVKEEEVRPSVRVASVRVDFVRPLRLLHFIDHGPAASPAQLLFRPF